jgi:hypothetical protein
VSAGIAENGGIATKRRKKRRKKDYRLSDPCYTRGADRIDLQGTTRPAELFALLFLRFLCLFAAIPLLRWRERRRSSRRDSLVVLAPAPPPGTLDSSYSLDSFFDNNPLVQLAFPKPRP